VTRTLPYLEPSEPCFPEISTALTDPDGLLAAGGALSVPWLVQAYADGIFPWFDDDSGPILWWSPNPRCVLEPDEFKISRSLKKTIRKEKYRVSFNRAFTDVINKCAETRTGREDTWITEEMNLAYKKLHEQGYALSVECWNQKEKLVGGLYGVAMGKVFFGESMFSRESDASKIAMVYLVNNLIEREFRIIDCQVHSRHLQSLGAKPITRDLFISILQHYCEPFTIYNWPQHRVHL